VEEGIVSRRLEDQLQIATARYNRLQLHPAVIAHHSANEREGAAAGGRAKAMGQLAGVWDWQFIWPNNGPHPEPLIAYIELKIGKNGLTDSQKAFELRLDELGIPHRIARNLDEYVAAVKALGIPVKYARSTGI
jgi:hypothetical protein